MESCTHEIKSVGPDAEGLRMLITCSQCGKRWEIVKKIQTTDNINYAVVHEIAIPIES